MPAPTTADVELEDAGSGFYRHSLDFLSAALSYGKARFQLVGLESKEAGVHYGLAAVFIAAALVVVVLGYVFFCLAVVFLIAWLLGDGHSWIWVTLGMALIHFGGAAALVIMAKNKFTAPVFATTLEEFKKDHEWLNSKSVKRH
ncbi:MAG: hypothetical protein JWL59_1046 [Chthoniobacteraceae bacterium]|nr:hypothetical protein [Chthoniobacteraceae bacterium]